MASPKRPYLAMSTGAAPFRVVVFSTQEEWEQSTLPFGQLSFLVDLRSLAKLTPPEVAHECADQIETDFRRRRRTPEHSDLYPIPIALVGKRAAKVASYLVREELGPTRAYVCTKNELEMALEHTKAKSKHMYQLCTEGMERMARRRHLMVFNQRGIAVSVQPAIQDELYKVEGVVGLCIQSDEAGTDYIEVTVKPDTMDKVKKLVASLDAGNLIVLTTRGHDIALETQ